MNPQIITRKNKVVLIGDSNVGKTCILERLIKNSFESTKPTIGACHYEKIINDIKIDLWDTAGQERFRSMVPMYYKGCKGIIIVFDITDSNSFDGAKKWLNEINQNVKDIEIFLVGNKLDLSDRRSISREIASRFAKDNYLEYVETSAKENLNINALFEMIGQKLSAKINKQKEIITENNLRIGDVISEDENSRGYCC